MSFLMLVGPFRENFAAEVYLFVETAAMYLDKHGHPSEVP